VVVPQFILGGVTFTFNDGDVENIQSRLAANLDFDSMPLSTPDAAMLYDMNGVNKIISISGRLSNSGSTRTNTGTTTTIDEQRKWIEQNLNGNQNSGLFISNYTSTWDGTQWINSLFYIATVTWNEQTGDPSNLPFTIDLYVGDV